MFLRAEENRRNEMMKAKTKSSQEIVASKSSSTSTSSPGRADREVVAQVSSSTVGKGQGYIATVATEYPDRGRSPTPVKLNEDDSDIQYEVAEQMKVKHQYPWEGRMVIVFKNLRQRVAFDNRKVPGLF